MIATEVPRRKNLWTFLTLWLLTFLHSENKYVQSYSVPFSFHLPLLSNRDETKRCRRVQTCSTLTRSFLSLSSSPIPSPSKKYDRTLAILSLPKNSSDKIGNEFILTQAISRTHPSGTLSVILRCRDEAHPSLPTLRSHVGEIYSIAWDIITGSQNSEGGMEPRKELLNMIVYPQHLPNTPPEQWLYRQPGLECIISHDSILGWHSIGSSPSSKYADRDGDGEGGLKEHVNAINRDRASRDLPNVVALNAEPWPVGASPQLERVVFLEDAEEDQSGSLIETKEEDDGFLLAGTRVRSSLLFRHVAVGGTFDGMHYGHRKLLTLAVSSVRVSPESKGKLLVGVTSNKMLQHKQFSEDIESEEKRIESLKNFLGELAPGMKNQIKIEIIEDVYGPPAREKSFDALILSDETLGTGQILNDMRVKKGLDPLTILCTRRTESYVMSSTALRRRRRGSGLDKGKENINKSYKEMEEKNDTKETNITGVSV